MSTKPVFFDPSGTRQWWVTRLGLIFGTLTAVAATLFALSLLVIPFLVQPDKTDPTGLKLLNTERKGEKPNLSKVWNEVDATPVPASSMLTGQHLHVVTGKELVARVKSLVPSLPHRHSELERLVINRERDALLKEVNREQLVPKPVATPSKDPGSPVVAAFYAPWQETGLSSFRQAAKHLTTVMPEWLHLDGTGAGLDFTDYDFTQNPGNRQVEQLARQNGVAICPLLSNATGTVFDPERVTHLFDSPDAQHQLIVNVRDWLVRSKYQGLNLDFENLNDDDYNRLGAFATRLGNALHAAGLTFSADVEADLDDNNLQAVAAPCDYVVLMAYDEHSSSDAPGPISSINWGASLINHTKSLIPAHKIVLGVGNYAYDWTLDSQSDPKSLTYQEALLEAQEAGGNESPRQAVDFDPQALNATFEYQDAKGKDHEVWMLDAISAYNQWQLAQRAGLRGGALWVLGSEDPSLWAFFRHDGGQFSTEALRKVSFPYEVTSTGEGEILRIASQAKMGERALEFDQKTGLCSDQQYLKFPSSTVIAHSGFSHRDLVLTFDDGPDPEWTPPILDILKQYHVKASFFMIGDNAEKYPGLVRRVYDEGHDIGNHTFTHPNLGIASPRRVELELNATQRAIEGITGHSTRMFRPPYNADAEPQTISEVAPIQQAANLGYLTIGEFIDPQDWNPINIAPDGTQSPRTAQEMIRDVMRGADDGKGNIILLHDAGGDRAKTIETLKVILPALLKKGFHFVPVSQLAGGRAAMMPPISDHQRLIVGFDRAMFNTIFGIQWLISLGFIAAIALGFARLGLIVPLATVARFRERRLVFDSAYQPFVSVLIAAYNEEKTIERTIRSVLSSDYPHFEVIVVDDGSKDETSAIVEHAFGNDPRVVLRHQSNGGKASALNNALEVAQGEIYVGFDADTQVASDSISLMIRHFRDERIGAVAGNVKVGNSLNVLTRWQSIEYITSQNLDRRAYGLLNAITVVPGAIGAWRRDAVQKVGGYLSDTLAEDMDLTWRLRRKGWVIANETRALAFTEAPDSLRALFKQRFRWAYGTLQCLTKHRKALGRNGVFGRVTLPMVWIFQFILQWLAPLVDLQLGVATVSMALSWYLNGTGHGQWTPDPHTVAFLQKTGFFYALFFAGELAGAAIAIRLDKEKNSLLWWLFWQRVVYRQMLYCVIWKATWTALVGFRQGWGKLARKGTVSLPSQSAQARP